MEDQPDVKKNPRIVSFQEAKELNKKGFGIFVTINGFEERRVKDNLVNINAWAIDLDQGTKQEQEKRIERANVTPTMIIETKGGYHVWWAAKEGATKEGYEEIVGNRLVPFFGADPNAKDLCRVLRLPQFLHMKDPQNPFPVEIVFWNPKTYSEEEMLKLFSAPRKQTRKVTRESKPFISDLENIHCKQGLSSLSGTHWVNGDEFTFRRNHNGTEQIWVNGKSSSCWIDKNGMIGSHDKGGPSLWQWLHWYYRDYKKVKQIMQEHFIKN